MRTLNFDPGAERCGWAVLEGDGKTPPIYVESGVVKCKRKDKEEFQEYKLRLEEYWAYFTPALLNKYLPDKVTNETVPAVGGGNFIPATQSELAKAVITAVHVIAYDRQYSVDQIAAVTIKKRIGGKKSATKVAVRNGVIVFLPELLPRKFQWQAGKEGFDEPDAIATGLAYLGYDMRTLVGY